MDGCWEWSRSNIIFTKEWFQHSGIRATNDEGRPVPNHRAHKRNDADGSAADTENLINRES